LNFNRGAKYMSCPLIIINRGQLPPCLPTSRMPVSARKYNTCGNWTVIICIQDFYDIPNFSNISVSTLVQLCCQMIYRVHTDP